jgi:hypothetical protein
MSKTKEEFVLSRLVELIDTVIARERIPKDSLSYADLGWVKFYAKDLANKCEGCKEAPHGSETDKDS